MIEVLAIPAFGATPCPLDRWVEACRRGGATVDVVDEGDGLSWLVFADRAIRGQVERESGPVEAIDFVLSAADPAPDRAWLAGVVAGLGYELHDDSPDEDDEDE